MSITQIKPPVREITQESIDELREIINRKLSEINVEGITVSVGNGSYSKFHASLKLEVSVTDSNGEPITKDEAYLRENGKLIGIHYGQKFGDKNQYTAVGFRPRAQKPLVGLSQTDGKKYIFSLECALDSIKK